MNRKEEAEDETRRILFWCLVEKKSNGEMESTCIVYRDGTIRLLGPETRKMLLIRDFFQNLSYGEAYRRALQLVRKEPEIYTLQAEIL